MKNRITIKVPISDLCDQTREKLHYIQQHLLALPKQERKETIHYYDEELGDFIITAIDDFAKLQYDRLQCPDKIDK